MFDIFVYISVFDIHLCTFTPQTKANKFILSRPINKIKKNKILQQ